MPRAAWIMLGCLIVASGCGRDWDARFPGVEFKTAAYPDATYDGLRDTFITMEEPMTAHPERLAIQASATESGLFQWDVGAIPPGSAVTAVTITLFITNRSDAESYDLYEATKDWVEADATWTDAHTGLPWESAGARGATDHASTPLATIAPNVQQDFFSFDLNSDGVLLVQRWVDNAATNRGVILMDPEANNEHGTGCESSEGADPAHHPSLRVTFTPP